MEFRTPEKKCDFFDGKKKHTKVNSRKWAALESGPPPKLRFMKGFSAFESGPLGGPLSRAHRNIAFLKGIDVAHFREFRLFEMSLKNFKKSSIRSKQRGAKILLYFSWKTHPRCYLFRKIWV